MCSGDNVYNLVDKTNIRIAAMIASKASGYLGVASCFFSLSAAHQVPLVVLSRPSAAHVRRKRIEMWRKQMDPKNLAPNWFARCQAVSPTTPGRRVNSQEIERLILRAAQLLCKGIENRS